MCSDFAVEALINDWDAHLLGPNPFVKLGECSTSIELGFIPNDLKECSSVQLQLVGQLCEKGTLNINALGGTIVFGLKEEKKVYPEFDIKLLTIVTSAGGQDKLDNCEIAAKRGSIGHVMLTFKSGGTMLLSAGHWIEMNKFDVDVGNLEKVVEQFGETYKNDWNVINSNTEWSESEKSEKYQNMANCMIQQSTPCQYSNNVNFQKIKK